jgi:hypothetical protein
MKSIVYLFLLSVFSVSAISCKSDKANEEKKASVEETKTLKSEFSTLDGEFIHVDTAAVLKVRNKLYGVTMDDLALEAIEKSNALKTDDYDVINVTIQAEIKPNTETEGWEEIVTIKSIDNVYKPKLKEETKVLKYSSNKSE